MNAVPEGFSEITRLSPFNALVGPLYQRRSGKALALGLRIEEKHTNSRGVCHGGVLATFADLAMGYAMQAQSEAPELSGFVTAQLSVDYAGAAKLGDWIESSVEIQRVGARVAFVGCYIVARGERIVRASALFARAGKDE